MQRAGLGLAVIAAAIGGLAAMPAAAANSPTFRDCSFTGGADPDFVRLTGATIGPNGQLTVPASQSSVTVEASESSDPGDSSGHDTLSVMVGTGNGSPRMVSGSGTGHVTLTVPLSGGAIGGTYTIGWAATFDNGFHSCPSSQTPQNPSPTPFVLSIVAGGAQVAPVLSNVAETHKTWRLRGARGHGRKRPLGTAFSFVLNEQANVTLTFFELRPRGPARRGTVKVSGQPGPNRIHFTGHLPKGRRLAPGRYRVKITAASASGQRSAPQSLSFRISR